MDERTLRYAQEQLQQLRKPALAGRQHNELLVGLKGCMCMECRYAKKTEDESIIKCDNFIADDYGMKLNLDFDGCDSGEVEN